MKRLAWWGLVPDVTETIATQLQRVQEQLQRKNTDLNRFLYLMGLLDNGETLFCSTLMSDPARFLEIVCDPMIGEVCHAIDPSIRRSHGMVVSLSHRGRVRKVLRNWPVQDGRFIWVTNAG